MENRFVITSVILNYEQIAQKTLTGCFYIVIFIFNDI